MRIAIYHNLPSGGAKRTLYEETRRLSERHTIDIYSLTSANHEFGDLRPYANRHNLFEFKPLPLLKSPFGRLNQGIRFLDLLRLELLSRSIAGRIERTECDVLLAHPCRFEQAPAVCHYATKLPVVYYCHEPLRLLYEQMPPRPYEQAELQHRKLLNRVDPFLHIYRSALKHYDRRNTRSAVRILVNSKFTCSAVRHIYQVEPQVSYHGVDAQLFHPQHVEKENLVFSVGSLTPLKGFDFLIQAISEIPFQKRPVFTIASNFHNPQEKHYLETMASRLGVELRLLGNITDERLVDFYNRAQVTIYSPIREPFGLVPLESMSCGTPVVAVREGGILESIKHGETGFVVERNPARFAAALEQLLDDPALAAEFGKRGREHILKFWTWEQRINTLEEHLKVVRHFQ